MSGNDDKKRRRTARAIRSERDYRGAAGVVKKLAGQTDLEADAEKRLRALIREMDKFEEAPDEDDPENLDAADYGGPLRRWSDGGENSD